MKNKETKNEIDIKKIGNLKAQFSTKFDGKDSDSVFLHLELSEEFREFLKFATIDEMTDFPLEVQEGGVYRLAQIPRYRVKRWVYSALGNNRDWLFSKELIDSGTLVKPFENGDQLTRFVEDMKYLLKQVVEVITRVSSLKMAVTFEVGGAQ